MIEVLFDARRYNELVAFIEALPQEIQKKETLLFYRADCYYELGEIGKAEALYLELTHSAQTRTSIHARYNLVLCLREIKRYDEALIQLRAIDLAFSKTRSLLGELLCYTARGEKQKYEESVALLTAWLRENPDDGLSRHILASSLNHLDMHDAALEQLQECIKRGYTKTSVLRDVIIELDWLDRPADILAFAKVSLTAQTDPAGELQKLVIEKTQVG